MTVLFANPPWWTTEPIKEQPGRAMLRRGIRAGSRWPFTMPSGYAPDQFTFGHYMPYPFFLGSAAAYVTAHMPEAATIRQSTGEVMAKHGAKVILRDSIARGESYNSFFSYVAQLRPDCLVLETGAASWKHDRQMLADIKTLFPKIRIAVAGPTAQSASATDKGGVVDAWLLGEYEKNAFAFVQGANGLLPFNLLTREEMNALPFPMFDEGCALNYWDACPTGQQAPHLQLLTSRGCVYKCCFCAWPATMTGNDPDGTNPRSVRFHSAEWVEEFIRDFLTKHPETRSIYLDDDTFNLAEKHTKEICAVMKRIGLPWSAMCRADTISRETWQLMKDSGCFGVKLGIESISQRVVTEIVNKKLDVKEALETARWLRSIGMTVHLTLTVGLPGETAAERQATIDFAKECQAIGYADTFQLSGTATIEGTPLDAIAHGQALKAFPGAVQDPNFVLSHDGVAKVEAMKT